MSPRPPDLPLPFDAPLERWEAAAQALRAAHRAGDGAARQVLRRFPPRLGPGSEEPAAGAELALDDARLVLARAHDYGSWDDLVAHVTALRDERSPVHAFEHALEALVSGDEAGLRARLRADPELVRARSSRVTPFDPPVHRATLLHYVAANGVEGARQRTPANAVALARLLLASGAEVDALAELYGGRCTTLSLLVSSAPPAAAGLELALVELLLDAGADPEGRGTGRWLAPLMTALAFGHRAAAELLVRRGARADTLPAAAGLGHADCAARLLPRAAPEERHRALALAAQHGHAAIVRALLDAGEDPGRFNPPGLHAHSTPLHQAALAGHAETARLLVARGARLDLRDRVHDGTPGDWARHAGHAALAAELEG